MSEILRLSSAYWSLIHTAVIFLVFFRSKYSVKKTVLLSCIFVLPIIAANMIIFTIYGADIYGKLLLLTLVLPTFIFFYIISSLRDFRFLFTFCLVDTVSAALIILSSVLNYYITPNTNILMFLIRVFGFLILEIASAKKYRHVYFEIQESVTVGWGLFTLVAIVFYTVFIYLNAFPTAITERPEDMPTLLIFIFLMSLMYVNIFLLLFNQLKLNEARFREELWILQSNHMQRRISHMTEADKRVRFERHNLRHRLQTIDMMLQKDDLSSAREYIANVTEEALETPIHERYCVNTVLDAVFSYYIGLATEKGIRVEHSLSLEQTLPVPPEELSVVIANALENAIIACENLPEEKRYIKCKCIQSPQLIFSISNPFEGEVEIDSRGVPVNREVGHGIGVRSTVAFCEKHNAVVDYKIEDGVFSIRIVIHE